MNELISVVVPMYNCGKYIKKCVMSLLEQTYKNIEVIVIDDGSTDNGSEFCREIGGKDGRLIYIRQDNGGVSAARNNGLKHAHGELITFCDGDDFEESDMIEYLVSMMNKYGADIVQCGVIAEYEEKRIKLYCPYEDVIIDGFSNSEKSVLKHYGGTVYCKLYKREVLTGLSFNGDYPIGEDLFFNVETALKAKRIVLSCKPKYHYIQRGGSICYTAPTYESISSLRNVFTRICGMFPEKSGAARHFFDERLRNDFDICSRYVRAYRNTPPDKVRELVGEVRRELRVNLKYIKGSEDFSRKEKIKARLIVGAWSVYSFLVRAKKREELKS